MDIGNKVSSIDIKVYTADTQPNKEVQPEAVKTAKIVEAVVKDRSVQDKKSGDAKVIDFTSKAHEELDEKALEVLKLASEVTSQLSSLNTEVKVAVDRDSGSIIFKILDTETNDLIKQIPSEEMLEISRRLSELLEDYASMQEDRKKVLSVFQDTL